MKKVRILCESNSLLFPGHLADFRVGLESCSTLVEVDSVSECDVLLVIWFQPNEKVDIKKIQQARARGCRIIYHATCGKGMDIPADALDVPWCYVLTPSAFPDARQIEELSLDAEDGRGEEAVAV